MNELGVAMMPSGKGDYLPQDEQVDRAVLIPPISFPYQCCVCGFANAGSRRGPPTAKRWALADLGQRVTGVGASEALALCESIRISL